MTAWLWYLCLHRLLISKLCRVERFLSNTFRYQVYAAGCLALLLENFFLSTDQCQSVAAKRKDRFTFFFRMTKLVSRYGWKQ